MKLQGLLAWQQSWYADFPYNEICSTAERAKEELKNLTEADTNLNSFLFLPLWLWEHKEFKAWSVCCCFVLL